MKWLILPLLALLAFTFSNSQVPAQSEVVEPVAVEEYVQEETVDEDEIFKLVNKYRQSQGVKALKRSKSLDNSAREKCLDMRDNNYFEHINPITGETPFEIIARHYDYKEYAGENLFYGFNDETATVDGWKNSPDHHALIVDPDYNRSGIALCWLDDDWTRVTDTRVTVQHFAD